MSEIVMQGVELALLGMGTVFLFLTALVLLTMAMSKWLGDGVPRPDDQNIDPTTLAVISEAIQQYKARRGSGPV
ncbi:MAG: OadG family protein [Pseudomonadales bacterium]